MAEPTNNDKLVGTYRRFGDAGPVYLVMSVQDGKAEIEFPESDEKVTVPVAAVLLDPIDK